MAGAKRGTKKRRKTEADLDPRLVARGQRMAEVREAAGFPSQLRASQKAATDSGTISDLESGKKDLTVTTAEKLADAYGCSLDVLVGRVPMPAQIDRYPARQALLESPEFMTAPQRMRQRFIDTTPDGAERWGVVRWVERWQDFLRAVETFGEPPDEPEPSRKIRPMR